MVVKPRRPIWLSSSWRSTAEVEELAVPKRDRKPEKRRLDVWSKSASTSAAKKRAAHDHVGPTQRTVRGRDWEAVIPCPWWSGPWEPDVAWTAKRPSPTKMIHQAKWVGEKLEARGARDGG